MSCASLSRRDEIDSTALAHADTTTTFVRVVLRGDRCLPRSMLLTMEPGRLRMWNDRRTYRRLQSAYAGVGMRPTMARLRSYVRRSGSSSDVIDRHSTSPAVLRLGVYSDGPFRVVQSTDGRRLAPDPADHPFLSFVCAVGSRFDSILVFARAVHSPLEEDDALLPKEVDFVELPFYESLFDVGRFVRSVPGTVRGFWRGLGQVDAVWVLGPHPYAFLLIPLALVGRKRVILGVRQDSVAYYRTRLRSPRWKPALVIARALDLGYRALSRRLPTIVVGDELSRRYGGESPTLLTTTVSLVRDADIVTSPQPRDWTNVVSLFTAGRIDREKNPLLLVEAIARLEREQPGRFRLVWAGTGPLAEAIRRRAHDLGIADRIEFLGFTPFGADFLERYRSAHAFVHVSLTEGVPATLIEALASGTPVIATAVGGVPAALDGGRAGVLVPPADLEALVGAILRLANDEELRDKIVSHGLQLARGRTIEANSALVAAFIEGGPTRDPKGRGNGRRRISETARRT
jgi:glycosyltransferase involved in cell wall biosynthesis